MIQDFIDLAIFIGTRNECKKWVKRTKKQLNEMKHQKMTFYNAYRIGLIESDLKMWGKEID